MAWYNYDDIIAVKHTGKNIKVIGVGGGGSMTANYIYKKINSSENKLPKDGIEFIVINSDSQALMNSPILKRIQIAEDGQGAGSDPKKGREYAEKCSKRIEEHVRNSYLLFITAGMGGGTGTGAAPVVARIAKQANPEALIIGVVTTPFTSPNQRSSEVAEAGIDELKKEVNALLIVSNDSINVMIGKDKNAIYNSSMRITDQVLYNAISGILGIITEPGEQNADFRDVYNLLKKAGTDVIIGVGGAEGPDMYRLALEDALSSPLLCGRKINGAKGIIVNFKTSAASSRLDGVNYVRNTLCGMADPNAIYKDCTTEDETQNGRITITVIAADFVDERGDLVTYINRVAAAHGLKPLMKKEAYSAEDEKNEQTSADMSAEEEIHVPDFSVPTFKRNKRN